MSFLGRSPGMPPAIHGARPGPGTGNGGEHNKEITLLWSGSGRTGRTEERRWLGKCLRRKPFSALSPPRKEMHALTLPAPPSYVPRLDPFQVLLMSVRSRKLARGYRPCFA